MKCVVVIPARYGSTRFPGKPLANIAGKSMLLRVWSLARAVKGADEVLIATDDTRILEYAESIGARVVLTPAECANGTERTACALRAIEAEPEIVVNLQGDAVLTPPWVMEALIDRLRMHPESRIATPAVQLGWPQYRELEVNKARQQSSGTLVVFDARQQALYFSKSIIPFIRHSGDEAPPVYRHIGLYAYRHDALAEYLALPEGRLERAEGLEQLRALEHGMPVDVVVVDYKGRTHWSVDAPPDVQVVEEIITREGELPGIDA